jgi:hypothetical protein
MLLSACGLLRLVAACCDLLRLVAAFHAAPRRRLRPHKRRLPASESLKPSGWNLVALAASQKPGSCFRC